MKELYQWIQNLTGFFLFLSVAERLLPGKQYGKYLRLFSGMILVFYCSAAADRGDASGGYHCRILRKLSFSGADRGFEEEYAWNGKTASFRCDPAV